METVSPHVGHRRRLCVRKNWTIGASPSPKHLNRKSTFLDDFSFFFPFIKCIQDVQLPFLSIKRYIYIHYINIHMIHMLYIYIILYTHSRRNKTWIHWNHLYFCPSTATADLSLCLLLFLELVRLSSPPFSPALGQGRPRYGNLWGFENLQMVDFPHL
jgi:hypothetical protein